MRNWSDTIKAWSTPSEGDLNSCILCVNYDSYACMVSNGTETPHCQSEKKTGVLPQYWGWVQQAKFNGNYTFHSVVYDEWLYNVSYILTRVSAYAGDFFSQVG